MRHHPLRKRRGSYVMVLEDSLRSLRELQEVAAYLSEIAVEGFEVVVVDRSGSEENRRVLRWVGRYIVSRLDAIRAAIDVASCEKVIVADSSVRYAPDALDIMSALLELHEVVEPQDYFDPLPTLGFRKRILASRGAEVFKAMGMFVRRLPPGSGVRDALRAALFFVLVPALVALSLIGGVQLAAEVFGTVAFASVILAIRGRFGATIRRVRCYASLEKPLSASASLSYTLNIGRRFVSRSVLRTLS